MEVTEERMALIKKAEALHGVSDPAKHAALAKKVLALSLSAEDTMAMAEELAKAHEQADGEIAKAEVALERAKFRAWMRVQTAAQQGALFAPTPKTAAVTVDAAPEG